MTSVTVGSLSRRDLLALAPACALASGLAAPTAALAAPCAGAASAARSPVAIGYWTGSGALAEPPRVVLDEGAVSRGLAARLGAGAADGEPSPSPDIVPAESLAFGDPRLAGAGGRIRIHGMIAGEPRRVAALPSLALEVDFDPARRLRFSAWSFDGGAAPRISSPVAFDVPVGVDSGLTLAVRWGGPGGDTAERRVRFTPGGDRAAPKLRRGLYLIGWPTGRGPSQAGWRGYAMAAEAAAEQDAVRRVVRLQRRRPGPLPGDFAALVLSVDYARGDPLGA